MISLHELNIKNFMSIDSADFDFSDGGFFVFKGQFGAGKSSVLAAIALCWIEHRRGDSYKDFIKQGTEDCSVHLTGMLLGHPIEFETTINDKYGVNKKIIYKGTTYKNSECTTFLASLDIDYLQHIMFSMQGEGNITDLKPAERTKLLKKIFDFEFQSELSELEKRQNEAIEKGHTLRVQLEMLNRREFKDQELRPVLSPSEKQNKKVELERLEIEEQHNQRVRSQYQLTLSNKEAIQRSYDSYSAQIASIGSQCESQENYLTSLRSNLTSTEGHLVNLSNEKDIQDQIDEQKNLANKFNIFRESELKQLLNLKDRSHEELQRKLEIETHIKAHSQGICSQCGQATHPENLPQMADELVRVSENYKNYKTGLDEKEKNLSARNRQIYEAESRQRQLEETLISSRAQRETVSKRINELKSQITQTEQSLSKLKDSKRKAEMDKEMVGKQLDLANVAILPEPKSNQSAIADLQAILSSDDTAVEVNKVLQNQNKKLQEEKIQNKKDVDENIKQQQVLASETVALREAQKIIEVDLPNYIIVKACGKIEKYINEFIQEVKPEMAVRLLQKRGGVDFFYSPLEGVSEDKWLSTKMASGFEKELLSIAWRVALARAYHLPILILDEIDSAANPAASEATYKTLARQEEFEQVFVISHKEEIANTLTLEAENVAVWLVDSGTFTREI